MQAAVERHRERSGHPSPTWGLKAKDERRLIALVEHALARGTPVSQAKFDRAFGLGPLSPDAVT
jgi:hypothetical protein